MLAQKLHEMQENSEGLKKQVVSIILSEADDVEIYLTDLSNHGCGSGMVSALIYYSATLKFYETHKEGINELLQEALSDFGFKSPFDLFGDKLDSEDPLFLETTNQNLLAWFAFEETARQVAAEIGLEI
jgi:hypothetical protein